MSQHTQRQGAESIPGAPLAGLHDSWLHVLQLVNELEHETGLDLSFNQRHRSDPQTTAFQWNTVCAATLLRVMGKEQLQLSALATAQTFSTGCSGFETAGLGVHCLKIGMQRVNIGCQLNPLASCVAA